MPFRILGAVLTSQGENRAAVGGRIIGLAERLGVAVAESSAQDAELFSERIRKSKGQKKKTF